MAVNANARKWWRSGTSVVVWIALGTVVVHLATAWRYGFDRDELMALDDARNLAWGYVQYPPMVTFFAWVALKLFGTSLGGFRLFASLAQAGALVLTGWMAREQWRVVGGERGEEKEIISYQLSVINAERSETGDQRSGGVGVGEVEARRDELRGIPRSEDSARNDGRWEGGEWAMVVATLAGVPFCLGAGALMSYISFDYLCWVWVAYCVVRVVGAARPWRVASDEWREEKEVISGQLPIVSERRSSKIEIRNSEEEPKSRPQKPRVGHPATQEHRQECLCHGEEERGGEKWWVGVGVGMGLGMLAKYTMGFLVVGVVVGVVATGARKYLRSVWLWVGVVLAWMIFLPNLIWEWRRNFVSFDFLRFLHARDVATGVTDWFLLGQVELTMLMAPLALAGLVFCFGWGGEGSGEWRVASGEKRVKEPETEKVEEEEIGHGDTENTEKGNSENENRISEEKPKIHPPETCVGHPATQEHRQERLRHSRWRILGWMYVVPLVLFLVMRGRDYYLAPAYPMLYAAGAVWMERQWRVASGQWLESEKVIINQLSVVSERRTETGDQRTGGVGEFEARRRERTEILRSEDSARNDEFCLGGEDSGKTNSADSSRNDGDVLVEGDSRGKTNDPPQKAGPTQAGRGAIWRKLIWVALAFDIVLAGAMALPIAPIGSRWWQLAAKVDLVFPDEVGWVEFVEGVAKVRDSLPVEERGRVGILAGNYGEVGALHLYGEKFGLPRAISGVNSSWERGYGDPPEVLIVVGYPRELLEQEFATVVLAGRTRNSYGVANEETREVPEIFVCRGMKGSWEEFWGKVRKYA